MSITDGQAALIRGVMAMADKPNVSLPNGRNSQLPRYVVQAAGGGQSTMGLSLATDARPEIVVRVETVADKFATESDALVSALVAHFAVGEEFEGVVIEQAPSVRPPIPSSSVYAVPVVIRGRTFF